MTRRKHHDDFARFLDWLERDGRPVTIASLDFATLVDYVEQLRTRPKLSGVWRGGAGALGRSLQGGPVQALSANTINSYMRPLRSLAIWLVDEGIVAVNPFRRSRRRAALNPLLPSPAAFVRLEPTELARRGRLWLTLYGAGYEPIHAWWFALSAESDIADMLATVATVPDDHFALMVQGRMRFEQGKAMVGDAVQ